MNLVYENYIKSPAWQAKRTERLKIDGWRCVNCGRPMDLQVHHINYERLGNEDVYRDLITLCKYCHQKIEKGKKTKSLDVRNPNGLYKTFWADIEQRDISMNGTEDFCKYDVITSAWYSWLKANGIYESCKNLNIPKLKTQGHFRNIRIRKILKWKEQGATPEQIHIYGHVSRAMVYKYYNNEALAHNVMSDNL